MTDNQIACLADRVTDEDIALRDKNSQPMSNETAECWAKGNADICRSLARRYSRWWHFGMWRHECREFMKLADEWEVLIRKFSR